MIPILELLFWLAVIATLGPLYGLMLCNAEAGDYLTKRKVRMAIRAGA